MFLIDLLFSVCVQDDIVAVNKPAGMAVHGERCNPFQLHCSTRVRVRSAGPKVDHHLSSFLQFWQDSNGNIPHLAHRVDRLAIFLLYKV